MSNFNPNEHLINLKGKKYLPVPARVVWFRTDHPKGAISTDIIFTEPVIVVKAFVADNDGHVIATGHGSAKAGGNAVWSGREIEKAETAAIGRALAAAGYGTQFTDEFDDSEHLSDSPQNNGVPESNGKTPQRYRKERSEGSTTSNNGTLWFQDAAQQDKVKAAIGYMPGAGAAKIHKTPADFENADALIAAYREGKSF